MIRPGIMLYGYLPDESLKNKIELKPSCVLKSRISFIKQVEKNTSISYGRTFITSRKSKIANVPIGYADGVPKEIKHVSINNKLYNVVGDICMDMISVKVDSTVQVGDTVILLGNDILPIKKVARECNTNSYTIFTKITNRVPRIYINK